MNWLHGSLEAQVDNDKKYDGNSGSLVKDPFCVGVNVTSTHKGVPIPLLGLLSLSFLTPSMKLRTTYVSQVKKVRQPLVKALIVQSNIVWWMLNRINILIFYSLEMNKSCKFCSDNKVQCFLITNSSNLFNHWMPFYYLVRWNISQVKIWWLITYCKSLAIKYRRFCAFSHVNAEIPEISWNFLIFSWHLVSFLWEETNILQDLIKFN